MPTGTGEPVTGVSDCASRTVTLRSPVTKTRVPSGDTATEYGLLPTATGEPTGLSCASNTVRVLS